MFDEQQQMLKEQIPSHERISNLRLRKQFQYLQGKYQYTVTEVRNITIMNILEHPLTIHLPINYPFIQPFYTYDGDKHPVSDLIDDWLPKYKIMQIIELVVKQIKIKVEQQKIVSDMAVYRFFNKMNSLPMIISLAVLLRVLIGLGGYSGINNWPQLGDLQAHRNWMSITLNYPINMWYQVSCDWWPLDYPPVAAYLSYFFALFYRLIQPESMKVQNGYQSQQLIAYMRFTALLVDLLCLFPPVILLLFNNKNRTISFLIIFCFLTKPDYILIDHGHFQYNSLILGLILLAYYLITKKNYYSACLCYTIAIHSKQMAVYYSLAFFCVLCGLTIQQYQSKKIKLFQQLLKYGIIVIFVSIIIWLPWLGSLDSFESVLTAIFPVHRGLYQLKVPNFWCISDILFKWQTIFEKKTLMILCSFACFLMSFPSMIMLMVNPTRKIMDLSFFCISMTFFMFSYHTHEKSILLPLLFVPFLGKYLGSELSHDLILAGCANLFHLLVEDHQQLQYFVLMLFYIFVSTTYLRIFNKLKKFQGENQRAKTMIQLMHENKYNTQIKTIAFYGTLLGLHIAKWFIISPANLPYLHNLLFAGFSFTFNVYSLILINLILLQELITYFRIQKKE